MRKRNITFFKILIVFIVFISIALIYFYYNSKIENKFNSIKEVNPTPSQIFTELMPSKISKEGLYPNAYINAYVSRIVDGDTIVVIYNKSNYKVRLLDVDTPESVKSGVPVQTYAKEASQFTKKSLLYKKVKLFFEKKLKDKYERLLAHVILMNKENFNGILVRQGYARAEIIKPNDAFKDYFYKQQDLAIQDKLGIWSFKADKKPFIRNSNGEYVPRY